MGKIIKIENECEDTKNFFVELPEKIPKVKAGQFVMVWVPGVDEFPIGVAGYKGNILELGIAKVGEGTTAIFNKEEGDLIGIRGFYGKGFAFRTDSIPLIIGGGFGMTPLKLLIQQIIERGYNGEIHVFEGARTKSRLMYYNWLQELHDERKIIFHVCTDDGSAGYKGFPTVDLEKFLQENDKSCVIYSAGPEKMMKIIFDMAKNYPHVKDIQMSLADRYMRCGYGLCGSCVVDPLGLRVCVDGPVFNAEQLEKIEDFGKYKRLPSGAKELI